ncbi:MAG: polyphosphate kinase 2 [Hyphomicrobiaceae bacterium]
MAASEKTAKAGKGGLKPLKIASPASGLPFDLDNPKLPAGFEDKALAAGGYPYSKKMNREKYETELRALQIELLKLQYHIRATGTRLVIVFEGRDSAGKGGCISRFMQHLNPRHARAVALSKPTETERGQWYFQRYIPHLPTAGDIVLFDRSWYNRAGVERVMGFCTPDQLADFLRDAPGFENLLVQDGMRLFKMYLTIGRETQLLRFHERRHDPLKQWKLTDIDRAAIDKFDAYTQAQCDMFRFTHTATAPWTVVRANDQRRARLEVIRHVLLAFEYDGKDAAVVGTADAKIIGSTDELMYGG